MKKITTMFLAFIVAGIAYAQMITPIENGLLTTDLDGGSNTINNVGSVNFTGSVLLNGVITSNLVSHVADSVIHVTAGDKSLWNGYGSSIVSLQSGTNNWNTAYSWGNLGPRVSALEGFTNTVAIHTAQIAANSATGSTHTAQIAALNVATGNLYQAIAEIPAGGISGEDVPLYEMDIRALKNYHYGDPDIEITPESEFSFDASTGTITGYSGTNANVIIPYEIGRVSVVAIGYNAFGPEDPVYPTVGVVTSVTSPKTVRDVGASAFLFCKLLKTVNLPAVLNISSKAFNDCTLLEQVYLGSVTNVGYDLFAKCDSLTRVCFSGNIPVSDRPYNNAPPNVTNYVLSTTATGWGNFFGGRPVVFPDVTAKDLTVKGTASGKDGTATNHFATLGQVNTALDLKPDYAATTNIFNSFFVITNESAFATFAVTNPATIYFTYPDPE